MTFGLAFRLEARPATEDEVAQLLERDLPGALDELALEEWWAIRYSRTSFGLLVTFGDRAAEESHVGDRVAELLRDRAQPLLADTPAVESFDVLATARAGASA